MKILCGALRPGFRSMRIDGKWYDRFWKQPGALSSAAGVYPRVADCGGGLRDFGLEWDDLTVWFPIFGKLRKAKIRTLSGGERRILECFVILRSRSLFAVLDEPFFTSRAIACCNFESFDSAENEIKASCLPITCIAM